MLARRRPWKDRGATFLGGDEPASVSLPDSDLPDAAAVQTVCHRPSFQEPLGLVPDGPVAAPAMCSGGPDLPAAGSPDLKDGLPLDATDGPCTFCGADDPVALTRLPLGHDERSPSAAPSAAPLLGTGGCDDLAQA